MPNSNCRSGFPGSQPVLVDAQDIHFQWEAIQSQLEGGSHPIGKDVQWLHSLVLFSLFVMSFFLQTTLNMYTFECNVMYVKSSNLIHVIIPDLDRNALVAVSFIAYVLLI